MTSYRGEGSKRQRGGNRATLSYNTLQSAISDILLEHFVRRRIIDKGLHCVYPKRSLLLLATQKETKGQSSDSDTETCHYAQVSKGQEAKIQQNWNKLGRETPEKKYRSESATH